MNQGVIAARYAKALLKYVLETGNGDIVYSQACMLVDKMYEVPKLEDYVCRHPEVVAVQKTELLAAALEKPSLLKLVNQCLKILDRLLIRNIWLRFQRILKTE